MALGMKLDTEEWFCLVFNPFVRAIIGVDEELFPVAAEGFHIDRKAVVLCGDITTLSSVSDAGLVLRTMAVFELVGIAAGCQGENLVAQADPKCRDVFFKCFSNVFDRFSAHLRIAGTVGDDKAVEFLVEEVVIVWDSYDLEVSLGEVTYDAVLDATVNKDNSFFSGFIINY